MVGLTCVRGCYGHHIPNPHRVQAVQWCTQGGPVCSPQPCSATGCSLASNTWRSLFVCPSYRSLLMGLPQVIVPTSPPSPCSCPPCLLQLRGVLDELLVGVRPGPHLDEDRVLFLGPPCAGALAGVAVPGGQAALRLVWRQLLQQVCVCGGGGGGRAGGGGKG
jgi:hypothetical protein